VRYSIVRRSAGVTVPFLVGHAFNYALLWGANHILDSGGFGLFYTAMLSINVLMSPVAAVSVVLARRFAEIGAYSGPRHVIATTRYILGLSLRATPFVLAVAVSVAAAAQWFGIEAWQVVVLIPMIVLALSALEILRASLQGILQFARASVVWVASTTTSCSCALGALLLSTKVWGALAGLFVGSVMALTACLIWFPRYDSEKKGEPLAGMKLELIQGLPMIASYSLFILLNNVDILVGYFLLSRAELDVYAASALLPKAIITATFAIAQVVLPVVTEQRAVGKPFRYSALKGLGIAAFGAGAGATFLWFGVPLLQQTPLAIRALDFDLLKVLAGASVALSILRVLVIVEVALHRYGAGFGQAGAIGLIALLCFALHPTAGGIAELYTFVVSGFLLLSCLWLSAIWIIGRKDLMKAHADNSRIIDGTGLK
jgi:O-antigen/teichoic acid export membrane protein